MRSGTDILKLFYEEGDKWSFSFENLVQLSRLRSLYESQNYTKKTANTSSFAKKNIPMKYFLERSIMSSYNVFVKTSYEEKRLNSIEFAILSKYYDFFTKINNIEYLSSVNEHSKSDQNLTNMNNMPFQIIYIKTTPEVCFSRLQGRSRESESGISLEYLTKIHLQYETWIESLKKHNRNNVIVIDGNGDKAYVIDRIKKIINN
jgi:deoxyadenosine/deoxycytidine kinase